MVKIKCVDKFGNEYEYEESEYIERRSVYGLGILENKIALVMDSSIERWELPGGGVDRGETDAQAVVREFFEETGLHIKLEPLKLLKNSKGYFKPNDLPVAWKTDRYYYLIEFADDPGEILENGNGQDTIAARFVDISEVLRMDLAHTDREVIEAYVRSL